jgi:hypothetical protein
MNINRLQIRKLGKKEIEKIEELKDYFSVGTAAEAVRRLILKFKPKKKKKAR